MRYLKSLIRNDTGDSSKSFFLVSVTIAGCGLLAACGIALLYDILRDGTMDMDLAALAALVGAVTTVFASAGVTKAMSERNHEKPNKDK